MFILRVTPVRNVLINRRTYRSEKPENFFNKIVDEGSVLDVYDVIDRKPKTLSLAEINNSRHRLLINDKKFFICSVVKRKTA